jgi:hypothetical protein
MPPRSNTAIFRNVCHTEANGLGFRERPDVNNLGERILEDCGKLKRVRDHVMDWVLLESEANPSEEFGGSLIERLARLLELKSRPPEVNT